jgi:hypothetical protein
MGVNMLRTQLARLYYEANVHQRIPEGAVLRVDAYVWMRDFACWYVGDIV